VRHEKTVGIVLAIAVVCYAVLLLCGLMKTVDVVEKAGAEEPLPWGVEMFWHDGTRCYVVDRGAGSSRSVSLDCI
jgi:hypothetical protein